MCVCLSVSLCSHKSDHWSRRLPIDYRFAGDDDDDDDDPMTGFFFIFIVVVVVVVCWRVEDGGGVIIVGVYNIILWNTNKKYNFKKPHRPPIRSEHDKLLNPRDQTRSISPECINRLLAPSPFTFVW